MSSDQLPLFPSDTTSPPEEDVIKQALLQVLPIIGLKVITKDNINEVLLRIILLEAFNGPMLSRNGVATYMTYDILRPYIGLTTNHDNLKATMDFWRMILAELETANVSVH